MARQRDNRVKVSTLLRAGHKVTDVANLVGLAHSLRDHETHGRWRIDVNRRSESGLKTVVDCDSLQDDIRSSSSTASNGCYLLASLLLISSNLIVSLSKQLFKLGIDPSHCFEK